MMIINPFTKSNFAMSDLFRTHPSTADRVARLETLKKEFDIKEKYQESQTQNHTSSGYDRRYVRKV